MATVKSAGEGTRAGGGRRSLRSLLGTSSSRGSPLRPHSPPPPPLPTPLASTTLVPSRPCEISVDGTPQQTDKRTFHAQSTVMLSLIHI